MLGIVLETKMEWLFAKDAKFTLLKRIDSLLSLLRKSGEEHAQIHFHSISFLSILSCGR